MRPGRIALGAAGFALFAGLVLWLFVAAHRNVEEMLHARSDAAEAEMRRLEYVLRRADELAGRIDAGEPGEHLEAAPLAGLSWNGMPPRPVRDRSPFGVRATVRAHEQWLDAANARIARGRRLEQRLPELERRIAELDAAKAQASAPAAVP